MARFYDDDNKYAVCLPTKTGSSNWLRAFYSLSETNGELDPNNVTHKQLWSVSKMPTHRAELEAFRQNRTRNEK